MKRLLKFLAVAMFVTFGASQAMAACEEERAAAYKLGAELA